MEEINLSIKEYYIGTIITHQNGNEYVCINEDEKKSIYTRTYDDLYNFFGNEYNANLIQRIGKTIYLISDNSRLLALRSENGEIVFVQNEYKLETDNKNMFFIDAKFRSNIDYINKRYGINKSDFLDILKNKIKQEKQLTLK